MRGRAKAAAKIPEAKRKNSVSQPRKTGFSQSSRSPVDNILLLQRTIGNQAVQRLFKSGVIQTKLKIDQPNDIYDQEADRVANQVMRMPEPQVQRQEEEKEEDLIQTKPLAEQITPLVQRQVEEEEEEVLQTKDAPSQTPEVTTDLESRLQSLRGSGQPLPKSVRAFFELRFGRDFSHIRVHNNQDTSEISRTLNARAFTVGQDVIFGSGQCNWGTKTGKRTGIGGRGLGDGLD